MWYGIYRFPDSKASRDRYSGDMELVVGNLTALDSFSVGIRYCCCYSYYSSNIFWYCGVVW